MAIDILVTTERYSKDPLGRYFIEELKKCSEQIQLDEAVLYYDFPSYSDYETANHRPDALLVSMHHGVIPIKFIPNHIAERGNLDEIYELDESLEQFSSIVIGRLLKSRTLRKSRTQLKFNVVPLIFCPMPNADALLEGCECDKVYSIEGFTRYIEEIKAEDPINDIDFLEIRSVLEGAKALSRSSRRSVEDPGKHRAAAALAALEAEITNFDLQQRRAAIVVFNGPQRIRGLAGSGKTVILAMKAAHLHMTNPDEKILVTYLTKSLKAQITNLITRFYRHFKEVDPDWSNLHIRHGWGGQRLDGAYTDACRRVNRTPRTLTSARNSAPSGVNPFAFACNELVTNHSDLAYYDHILIDEGQDFPSAFYELCFKLAKGDRDHKNIVWAYDELQNILNVRTPNAGDLFGIDSDGEPRISLERTFRNLPHGATNDTVLSKCYRNQREVLITSHALGFGIYSNIVQLLENPEHWRDVGYEVSGENFALGQAVVITRPEANSPVSLSTNETPEIIAYRRAENLTEECTWVINEIQAFLSQGLSPEDIMVVSLDDRNMQHYFLKIASDLTALGISCNNIIADPYSDPPFTMPGKVTLSSVYRAKGNEAAVVFALGVDALDDKYRSDRNKLFTAFTRTKAWLRISGCGVTADRIFREVDEARQRFPRLEFTMPDISKINLIQRDLGDRHAKIKKLRAEIQERLIKEGLTEDDIESLVLLGDKSE